MPKYLSQIDASRIPIKGLVPESSATAPSSPVEGQIYYDTALKTNRSYQNGSWVNITQGVTYAIPTQAEAEAGTATTGRVFSAQRVAQAITALQAVKSVAGKTGAVTLAKGDVGLSNVDNTADSAKPVSSAQQTALNLKANIASPTFTGVPAAPTAAVATNTTQLATTAFVQAVVSGMKSALTKADVGLGSVDNTSDANKPVSTATQTALNLKANLASPALTGVPTAPTAATSTSTTQLATTAFVQAVVSGMKSALTKADVGLSNVDNTSDAEKPISTATQTALNGKANTTHTHTIFQINDIQSYVDGRVTAGTSTLASMTYVDNAIQGIASKASVKVATTSNISLTGTQTIDGIPVVAGDRVLVKNQTTNHQNGIYVASAGAWFRSDDANTMEELRAAFTFVEQGATNGDTGWLCTNDGIGTIGSSGIIWTQFSRAGDIEAGAGLTKSGNTLSVSPGVGLNITAGNVRIAPLGVIEALLADNAVTNPKLATNSVSTVKILDANVTEPKLGSIPLTSSKLTGALPVAKGGTGATTSKTARQSLAATTIDSTVCPALTPGVWTSISFGSFSLALTGVTFSEITSLEVVEMDWRRVSTAPTSIEVRSDVPILADTIAVSAIGV